MNGVIIGLFVLGYSAIALEHKIKLNKAASALITGVLCWVISNSKGMLKELITIILLKQNHYLKNTRK